MIISITMTEDKYNTILNSILKQQIANGEDILIEIIPKKQIVWDNWTEHLSIEYDKDSYKCLISPINDIERTTDTLGLYL